MEAVVSAVERGCFEDRPEIAQVCKFWLELPNFVDKWNL